MSLSLSAQLEGLSVSTSGSSTGQVGSKLTLVDPDSRVSVSLSVPARNQNEPTKTTATLTIDGDGPTRIEEVTCAGTIDLGDVPPNGNVEVLARLSDADPGSPVGIRARIGRGAAAFWSLHLETALPGDQDTTHLKVLARILSDLGLIVPWQASEAQTRPRPTPQILTAAPWRPGVVPSILRALDIPNLENEQPYELKDSNDTFLVHASPTATRVLSDAREAAEKSGEDPATWNPKHIVVYTGGEGDESLPPPELTPKFDITTYYEGLSVARKDRGCPESYPQDEWGIGEALLYGEVVTSTQTMLDKWVFLSVFMSPVCLHVNANRLHTRNTRLLTSLPTPLLSLASAQLTGRGRGGNIWLSPPGCLQFSLLLRVPLSALPAQKIVFVQYLFALAVAEACRSEQVLGSEGSRVRIKWPNDIYAIARNGEKKKIGGILVNTSFGSGKVELVIGASSSQPICCLYEYANMAIMR